MVCFKNKQKLTTALFICFKKGLFPKEAEEKHETREEEVFFCFVRRITTFVYLFQEKKGLFQEQEENN